MGGLWSFSPDTGYTSVIHETVSNISKFVVSLISLVVYFKIFQATDIVQSGFSDFPIPKGTLLASILIKLPLMWDQC